MKTAQNWMLEISEDDNGHDCTCICDRCKNGRETFLLSSDIQKIQLDAYKAGMLEAAELIHPKGTPYPNNATYINTVSDAKEKIIEAANQKSFGESDQ